MLHHYHLHQTNLFSFTYPFAKPLSLLKPLFLVRTQTGTPKLRFGVLARASLATEAKPTMYDLLSVKETASMDEIKAAYRKVARHWHPDTCGLENKDICAQQFIKAREAYKVLCDPVLRADYDYGLQNGFNANDILFSRKCNKKSSDFGDWESQLQGLNSKSRSNGRNSSWGSRMRAKCDQL